MNTELHELALHKLEKARISLEIEPFDQKVLEKCGPAIFVCNQLLPGIDEWVLLALLSKHAETVRLLHPYPTPAAKALRPVLLRTQRAQFTDRFFRFNFSKKAARAVRKGESIGLSLDFSDNLLSQLGRNLLRPQILRELRKAGQPIVPIHLVPDHLPAGILRRAMSAFPLFSFSEPTRISVRVGSPIGAEELAVFQKNSLWGKFLQAKIFSLGSHFDVRPEQFTATEQTKEQQPLAEPVALESILQDIAGLKPEHKIASRGQFDVYVAPFMALPHVMFEIARLRELTFRATGEGTGRERDMDEYDIYYLQLVIWDREEQRIVGGYRLGQGDIIFKRFGINGFYTNSLFKFKSGFYPILQQAVELGRSYVVPEYQKHRLPLFLLWKGILYFLLANPHYRYLYGPVSISKYYSDVSKSLIVEFVTRFFFDENLAELVKPRKPFRVKTKSVDTRILAENMRGEFDVLENFVETIEPEHFKVPVLFRQYLRQNARFVAFNVDPNFSDCLDGLMILDMQHLPASTIETLS